MSRSRSACAQFSRITGGRGQDAERLGRTSNPGPTMEAFHSIVLGVDPYVVAICFYKRAEKVEVEWSKHLAVPPALVRNEP